jgi:hypothetical protein
MSYLYGEIPTAPILMALALFVAFVGCVGIGAYVVLHTAARSSSEQDVAEPQEAPIQHAA